MSLSCTRDVQWVEEDQPDPNEVHGYESPKFPVGSMTQPIVDWGEPAASCYTYRYLACTLN
ncbi:hypothetical protein PI124_g23828 [Phytophthora idaei]|nr:hypothetical protein PI126_g23883 [Phytophthora idaei]KAG3231077.1 hypothetical protein PI124_g23828 [Phytophthora idaei]